MEAQRATDYFATWGESPNQATITVPICGKNRGSNKGDLPPITTSDFSSRLLKLSHTRRNFTLEILVHTRIPNEIVIHAAKGVISLFSGDKTNRDLILIWERESTRNQRRDYQLGFRMEYLKSQDVILIFTLGTRMKYLNRGVNGGIRGKDSMGAKSRETE